MALKLELDSDDFNGLTLNSRVVDMGINQKTIAKKYDFDLTIGHVGFQEYSLGSKTWRYGGMSFSKNLALLGCLTEPRIEIYFSLEGLYHSHIDSHPKCFNIPSYKFSVSYAPNPTGKCFLLENVENRFFEVNINSDDLIRLNLTSSMSYELLLKSVIENTPFSLSYEGILMDGEMMRIIQQIEDPPVNQGFLSRYTNLKLEELIILSFQKCDENENRNHSNISSRNLDRVSKAVDYIKCNYEHFPTLDQISKAAMVCKSQLCADFKKVYGYSIMDYCVSIRMVHAENLVKQTDMTIAEIAYKIGYQNPQHFTAAFKRYFGVIPSLLRS